MVSKSHEQLIGKIIRYLFAIGAVFFALFPVYWMIGISFKPIEEWVSKEILWLPQNPTTWNYLPLFFTKYELGLAESYLVQMAVSSTAVKAIMNSLIAATGGTVLAMFVGTTVSYAMSRYRVGGDFMPFLFLSFRMLPPMAIIIPLVIWFSTIHLMDTVFGLVLLYGLFPMPFVIWLMRSFFDEIPKEVDEAALMDGCTPFQTFMKVILPLVKAGLAVTALFIFILNWSDFMIALVITRNEAVTIPVQLTTYMAETGQLYGIMAALGTIAIIPTVVFGLAIQRYLVRGFTFGAIKG
ncbi:MAG: carbohydrate ABC transporter permease [Candidatus Bathyarchaeota archaeon]|nr:carbohydrate ABC transporter permease [Candidatus Bathyarchaeota archaeon]